jgi:hypothetical protein
VPLEWGCGRTSGKGGRVSLVLLDFRWVMGLEQILARSVVRGYGSEESFS